MAPPTSTSLRPAVVLIAAVLMARLVYHAWFCPYDLVEDEAHYWLWSRHLDWSYYSKGPGIAWVIALATGLFGHAEWAVRLPTVLASSIGALACAGIVRDAARRAYTPDGRHAAPAQAALYAAAAFLLVPAFQLTAMLVTIDGCYLACWALATWAAWRALFERSGPAWLGLGAAVGAGFLFKYTILLLVPGILACAWIARRRGDIALHPRWRPWLAAGFLVAVAGLAPVLIWNAREDWPTVRHLLGHLGVRGGDMPAGSGATGGFFPLHAIKYLAAPLGMIGPWLLIALIALVRHARDRGSATDQARGPGVRLLACAFAPIFLFYLAVSLFVEPEQNWAIAGYVSLSSLAGWYAADELTRRRAGGADPALTAPPSPRTRPIRILWRIGLVYGLCAAAVLHRSDLMALGLNRVAEIPALGRAIASITGRPARPIVMGRLIGARAMAAHAARILDQLTAAQPGPRPMVLCEHYGRASQIAYYLFRTGRAETPVLSTQSVMGGRRSQFDFWPDTSLARPDLVGRSALLLSNDKPDTLARWRSLFERVDPLPTPNQKLEGEHKKDRVAYIGTRFLGAAPPPAGP